MVRLVLCVLCLVALALPASAHKEWIDPFHTHPKKESFYDRTMRELREQQRQEHEQFQRDYRNQRDQNRVTETNCLYGRDHLNKCL